MSVYLPWITFFIGAFVGALITWIIMTGDKRDLEARVAKLEEALHMREEELAVCRQENKDTAAEFKAEIKTLKNDLKAHAKQASELDAALQTSKDSLAECQAESASLTKQIDELQALAAKPAATRSEVVEIDISEPTVDDFTQIKGIGPALAARLIAAGLYTYADLAEADPGLLPDALGIQPWQKVEPDQWVAEAAVLAAKPQQVHVGDDLTLLEGIGPAYATRLRAAGITTFDRLAESDDETLAIIIGAPAWRRVHYGDWIAQAKLAAAGDEAGLKALQEKLFKRQGDNLTLIAGIGPQSVEVLHIGGINTFADLAAADEAALAILFKDADVRAGQFEAWIAEAKLRAAGKRIQRTRTRPPEQKVLEVRSCPQDLELIDGIGTVYEQRLYEVGVGSFWEVGMLPENALTEILDVQDFQDVDLAAIKADALRLAGETESMGRVWDGTEPDDFEPLVGIGPVLERRLYAAGICTFEALAAQTVAALEEICHAPSFQHVDYGQWIEQAKAMLA